MCPGSPGRFIVAVAHSLGEGVVVLDLGGGQPALVAGCTRASESSDFLSEKRLR